MFELTHYPEHHSFTVMGSQREPTWRSPDTSGQNFSPNSSQQEQPRRSSRRPVPLTTVKIVRADLGENGKPCNLTLHDLTCHVNILDENEACVQFLEDKVRRQMGDDTLVLVGTNGLKYYEQEGTRGSIHYFLLIHFFPLFFFFFFFFFFFARLNFLVWLINSFFPIFYFS